MNKKSFITAKLAIVVLLSATVSFSVSNGYYILSGAAILAAVFLLFTLQKKVKEVMTDERDLELAGRAARQTITIYSITMALVGATLMAMAKTKPELALPAQIMLYSTCALVFLYSLLYKKYAK